jgi:hypothetical protein
MNTDTFSPDYIAGAADARDLLACWRKKNIGAASMATDLTREVSTRDGERLVGFLAAVAAYTWTVMHMGEPYVLDEWDPLEDLAPETAHG